MLKRIFLVALCLFAARSHAQMRVELEFEQETYLAQEALYAIVTIYNSSGQTLEMGRDEGWLTLNVESTDDRIVRQIKPLDARKPFTLPSASRAKVPVEISKSYDLTRLGRYYVTAVVQMREWGGETFKSKPAHFGISPGVKLWEQIFGIPAAKEGDRPEFRKFQLIQANHLKELSLYVRLTDESEEYSYSVFPIGRVVGLSRPEPQLDRFSNMHLLYQNSAKQYLYTMITPDGLVLARQTWAIVEDSRPRLNIDKEGHISVGGGIRVVSGSDLPPPELLSERSAPPPEAVQPLDATSSN